MIYTTNAIESLHRSLRKILKTRGALPSDEAVLKLLYLALARISKRWTMPIRDWKAALNRFVIEFEGRVPARHQKMMDATRRNVGRLRLLVIHGLRRGVGSGIRRGGGQGPPGRLCACGRERDI